MHVFPDTSSQVSDQYLRRACELAARGRGTTSPNPMVGCVIVRDGIVVGEGFHERAGGPHAEVVALTSAGEAARGAHVYVTLEPCNHFGKTPPCAAALIRAGVQRVVIGMRDPDLSVSGGGAEAFAHAGVQVEFASDETPFRCLNEAWLKRLSTGLPLVRVKLAVTLDARLALAARTRSTITGSAAAEVTRQLRAGSRAVAVGASTAMIDDPLLTVRGADGLQSASQPMHVIISRTSVPPTTLRLFCDGGEAASLVVSDRAEGTALKTLAAAGILAVTYPYAEGILGALRALAGLGIDDVLVEAGPGLLSALWKAHAIDELYVLQAGGMGGNAAPPLFLGPGDAEANVLSPPMHAVDARVVGDGTLTVWHYDNDEPVCERSA